MLAYILAAVRFIGFLFLLVTGLFITGIVFPFKNTTTDFL